jgi:hypothetical protein
MTPFLSLVGDWHFWVLIAAYWFVSNAIGSLPMPDGTEPHPKLYAWFFKTANGFAANVSRATAGKIPGVDTPPASVAK